MKVTELTREQLDELKGVYIDDRNAARGEGTSYYEFVFADKLVTDAEVFEYYGGIEFSNDDFCCTAGTEA